MAPVVFVQARRQYLIVGSIPTGRRVDAHVPVFTAGAFRDARTADEGPGGTVVDGEEVFGGIVFGFVAVYEPVGVRR